MFGRRSDATRIDGLPMLRRFMPFVSPRRLESVVYFEYDVDVEAAMALCDKHNQDRDPENEITLFHVIIAAFSRLFHERPGLNRFTAGGRFWQRDGVWITFSAKMQLRDGAPLITLKRRIGPNIPIGEIADLVHDKLRRGRGGETNSSDYEMSMLLKLWPPLVSLAMRLLHLADYFGMLPKSMIDADPLYCSIFIANFGSIGLDAGFHHLWQHGTCPAFCSIGKVSTGPDGRRHVILRYTYDERIEDGLYCAGSLNRLSEMIEKADEFD